jgi:hypothetical protein
MKTRVAITALYVELAGRRARAALATDIQLLASVVLW